MAGPLLLPLAGLLGGLFMQNREARANQARLLAARNAQNQAFNTLSAIADPRRVMRTTPDRRNPNVMAQTMVGDQPGLLNVPSVLTTQRRDPVESGLLRTRMREQDAARERGETVEPDMTPGPGLLNRELRATEASMPFRFNQNQIDLLNAQALMDIPDANIRKETGTRLVENILSGGQQEPLSTVGKQLTDMNIKPGSQEWNKKISQALGKDKAQYVIGITNDLKPARKTYDSFDKKASNVFEILKTGKAGEGLRAVTLMNSYQRMIDDAVVRGEDIELQQRAQGLLGNLFNIAATVGIKKDKDTGQFVVSEDGIGQNQVLFTNDALRQIEEMTRIFQRKAQETFIKNIETYIPQAKMAYDVGPDLFAPDYNDLKKQFETPYTDIITLPNNNTNVVQPGPNTQNQNTGGDAVYVLGKDGYYYDEATGKRLE